MPTYIALAKWTPQGIQNLKQSPQRLDAARKAFGAAGANLKASYLTMGQYDFIVIFEAPDDETASKVALMTAAQGNIRTETLRAFNEEEYRKIITSLG